MIHAIKRGPRYSSETASEQFRIFLGLPSIEFVRRAQEESVPVTLRVNTNLESPPNGVTDLSGSVGNRLQGNVLLAQVPVTSAQVSDAHVDLSPCHSMPPIINPNTSHAMSDINVISNGRPNVLDETTSSVEEGSFVLEHTYGSDIYSGEAVQDLSDNSSIGDRGEESGNSEGEINDDEEKSMSVDRRIDPPAESRFYDWMNNNRKWVDIFIRFGVKLTLLDAILEAIGAPFKANQLRRNLAKYTDFYPTRYVSCRSHALLGEESEYVNSQTEPNCKICVQSKQNPDLVTFEYFPLEPRIRAWVRNEESCRALFEYYQKKLEQAFTSHAPAPCEHLYEDVFDAALFRRIVTRNGGKDAAEYDLFLAPSCDGFEPYKKTQYSCWPVVALNHNLPPTIRFNMKNTVPLGVIQGPAEPKQVHTWFKPLKDEVDRMDANGGTTMKFFDGIDRLVRVHILFFTGDEPAVAKMAGLKGHNSKFPCRHCDIQGVWTPFHSHMYFPSRCKGLKATEGTGNSLRIALGDESETKTLYDLSAPPMRNQDQIKISLTSLDDDSRLSKSEKEKVSDGCGIKHRTISLEFDSIVPFKSFPPDVMHKFMNICHDLMSIFKGQCVHLSPQNCGSSDGFVLSSRQWKLIDDEISSIASGTSPSVFPEIPRISKYATSWKAAECLEFLTNYALIVLEGRLPKKYMKNLHYFCLIVELCRRPSLSQDDVNRMKNLGIQFVRSFEKLYYKYDPRRVGVCKSTVHSILHLGWAVEQSGPPVYYSQFWVERFIGDIKGNVHATRLAGESLNENLKFELRTRLLFEEHLDISKLSPEAEVLGKGFLAEDQGVELLAPWDRESLSDGYHTRMKTRKLLKEYIMKAEDLSELEAIAATQDVEVWCYGRMEMSCGESKQIVGARDARRHRRVMRRCDFYASAEFFFESNSDVRDVFYGRILKILHYTFNLNSGKKSRAVLLMDWTRNIVSDSFGQIYSSKPSNKCFASTTLEDATVVLNGIGVVEHRSPSFEGVRTYFVDPSRSSRELLNPGKPGADGIIRNLALN